MDKIDRTITTPLVQGGSSVGQANAIDAKTGGPTGPLVVRVDPYAGDAGAGGGGGSGLPSPDPTPPAPLPPSHVFENDLDIMSIVMEAEKKAMKAQQETHTLARTMRNDASTAYQKAGNDACDAKIKAAEKTRTASEWDAGGQIAGAAIQGLGAGGGLKQLRGSMKLGKAASNADKEITTIHLAMEKADKTFTADSGALGKRLDTARELEAINSSIKAKQARNEEVADDLHEAHKAKKDELESLTPRAIRHDRQKIEKKLEEAQSERTRAREDHRQLQMNLRGELNRDQASKFYDKKITEANTAIAAHKKELDDHIEQHESIGALERRVVESDTAHQAARADRERDIQEQRNISTHSSAEANARGQAIMAYSGLGQGLGGISSSGGNIVGADATMGSTTESVKGDRLQISQELYNQLTQMFGQSADSSQEGFNSSASGANSASDQFNQALGAGARNLA
jgi:hypothetical protein